MLLFTYLPYLIKRSKKESVISKKETQRQKKKESKRQRGERQQRDGTQAMRQGGKNRLRQSEPKRQRTKDRDKERNQREDPKLRQSFMSIPLDATSKLPPRSGTNLILINSFFPQLVDAEFLPL